MIIDKCPHCGSEDLSPDACRKCLQPLRPPLLPKSTADGASREQIPPPDDTAAGAPPLEAFEQAERNVADATTPEEKEKAWEVWESAIFDYHQRGYSLVTLIGLSGAGKTFFANRLRHELRLRKGWTVDPYERDTITRTESKIECTQIVRDGRHRRRRVLADCDGEAYRQAIENLLEGQPIPDVLRRYVLMTSLASAYILMVPPPKDRGPAKAELLIDARFGLIVSAILALQRRLRETGDPKLVVQQGLRAEDISKAKEHEFTSNRPVLVLFSQADRYASLDTYAADPLRYAMTRAPQLVRVLDNHFTNYRFDFVSAFYGHTSSVNGMAHVDFSQPHSGVVPAYDWIDSTLEYPRLWKNGTRVAMLARRLLDASFRQTGRSLQP